MSAHAYAGRQPAVVCLCGIQCSGSTSLCHYRTLARPTQVGRSMAATEKNTMTPSNTQLCVLCGGTLEATTITHEVKRGTHIYLFQNVPAKICSECRDIWID